MWLRKQFLGSCEQVPLWTFLSILFLASQSFLRCATYHIALLSDYSSKGLIAFESPCKRIENQKRWAFLFCIFVNCGFFCWRQGRSGDIVILPYWTSSRVTRMNLPLCSEERGRIVLLLSAYKCMDIDVPSLVWTQSRKAFKGRKESPKLVRGKEQHNCKLIFNTLFWSISFFAGW